MTRAVVSIAHGSRYPALAARQRESLPGETVLQWVDELPDGAPTIQAMPWRAYMAKPLAMRAAQQAGYRFLLWLDASCYAIRPLDALWEQIGRDGYYCQENGFSVGQWCSDAALATLGIDREESFGIPEASTCALGLDLSRHDCRTFIDEWCSLACDGVTFAGSHTNDVGPAAAMGLNYRFVGHVSNHARVAGHRHDQTAASVLAWRRGWKLTPRPTFVDYWREDLVPDELTAILNHG